MANVKVVKHDHVRQKVTFEASGPITKTAPIPSNRKHPDTIRAEMEGRGAHGNFGLANVGRTLAEARDAVKATGKNLGSSRRKCDSCMFIPGTTSLPGGCKFNEDDNVCQNCAHFYGRPVCSWTPGIPAIDGNLGNSFAKLEARGDATNALIRRALNGLEGRTGNDTLAADPVILEVDQGDEMDEMELDAAERAADEQVDAWEGP
jgi:hypothetical protein